MSKRILQIGLVAMVVIGLAGCLREESSDEFEEDVQSLDSPINNSDPDRYRGRVINGELENALVWLDMDADGIFEGSFERLCDDGPSGPEPAALSDADGRFELDVSGLRCPKTESSDLDPRNYPLMVVAIPGLTENARTGVIREDKGGAFFLAAPPGVELVTPFTTMAFVARAETWRGIKDIENPTEAIEERRQTLSRAGTDITRRLSGAKETIGVYSDYLISGAERVPFYSEAFRRMIQAQIPDGRIPRRASAESAGDLVGTAIPPEDMDVIGSILLDQSEPLIKEVDKIIEKRGGTDNFQLPELDTVAVVDAEADLINPWLLLEQTLYLSKDEGEDFGASAIPDDVRQAGIITHAYSLGTALRRATARRHFAPSMQRIIRMANKDGRVSELGAQPGLAFNLDNPVDGTVEAEDSPDERFVFDWSDEDLARLQSPQRLGVLGLGSLDDYDREDGDRIYRESASNDRILDMERILGSNGDVDYKIEEVGPASDIDRYVYSLSIGETITRNLQDFSTCSISGDDNERVINAVQEIAVSGDQEGTEILYGHLREEGGDGPLFRVLIREFVADDDNKSLNWRWEIEYYDHQGGELLAATQPDLIRSMRLIEGEVALSSVCGDEYSLKDGIDAYVSFEHIPFTQYLEEVGTGN